MSLKVDSSLVCPHCIEVFTDPKILPACGHSLCKECIEDLMVFNILQRNNQSFKEHNSLTIYPGVSNVATDSNKYIQIKCPKCDKANFIHENAKIEDSLETDEELQKKCEQWKQSSHLCEEECGKAAELVCTDCKQGTLFCGDCFSMTHTSKTMQKHVAQPLTQLETTKKRCPDHTDLLLEYFCIDCTELVCVKCILMKQHKDHKFVQSTEYRSKISNEINESQAMLSSRIKILAKTQKSIELSIQELSEVHSELNSRIQVEWGKVLTATKHRIANMLTYSAYVEQEKMAWLERQREAIALFLQQLKEDTEYYNSRIETMSIPQLLHFKRQIIEVTESVNQCSEIQAELSAIKIELDLSTTKIVQEIEKSGTITAPYEAESTKIHGTLYGWGWNKFGQLGTGDTADRMEPVQIQLPSRIIKVVCGSGFSIALTEEGYCYSWGGNGCGQCGQGHVTSVLVPQLISALVTKKVIEISSSTGCNHSLALCDDGSVFSWGCNTRGQLGLSTNDHESSPQQVPFITEEETIEQIYVGGNGNGSSFIVTENGDLFAFGWNENGQLGVNDNIDRNSPQQVVSIDKIQQVAPGGHHTLMLNRFGKVFACGGNKFGQLGLNDLQSRNTPTEISILKDVVYIAAGGNYSFCLTKFGNVYAFGNNEQAQLGLSYNTHQYQPIEVVALRHRNICQLSCGWYHAMALSRDGTVFSWGWSRYGQLGTGDTVDSELPKQIDIQNVFHISAGGYHSFALQT